MFNRFATAVWIILSIIPEALAPFKLLENSQFFLPITNSFMARSARLFKSSNHPSKKISCNPSLCFNAYWIAFSNCDFGREVKLSLQYHVKYKICLNKLHQ